MKTVIVNGGAGFIGSAVVRHLLSLNTFKVINVDKLTYAGHLESLESVQNDSNYSFEQEDICDINTMENIFSKYMSDYIMHLAAESHVDRSIDSSAEFIRTNDYDI